MNLLQYRVDFSPELDHTGLKQALLRHHQSLLGKYIFDGTLLYGTTRYPQPMELFTTRKNDDTPIAIKLRLVGEVKKEDATHTNVSFLLLFTRLALLAQKITITCRLGNEYYSTPMFEDVEPYHDETQLFRLGSGD